MCVGIGILTIILIALVSWSCHRLEKRKQSILKQRHFKRNGGLLLKQKISTNDGKVENASTIFLKEDLEKATDNFNQNRIIGKGGFGTVYKGMLSNGRIVAIKKSKLVEENQVDQFINEVVLLSDINHRHIVKLLGCCLETEVPLLVYEFVSNGSLSSHLHGEDGHESSISWKDRLRIASEIAGALAYLHSEASIPIFHRDIKPDNILLDENFKSKVSDFGLARSFPVDKTHVTTKVRGTLGYLDPEYYYSGQFTEKSDVYSFGVLLVELLTGQKVVSNMRTEPNLAFHFLTTMKQNQLSTILAARVVNEGDKDEILVISKLVKRCLKLNIKKRPIMKEVASSLDGLKKFREPSMVDEQDNILEEQACHLPISLTSRIFEIQRFETADSCILSGDTADFESTKSSSRRYSITS
ncbi:wall-associated receptor kinase-like 22 [Papaver somniferum]|uniref:wall-associated receptor kinase-like 22 n=1 Tax=Papaver somniferum TaxID=3469 RepID=UPI000E703936|nr:wall-associated receptor kinase-like 22 [Papaver somniferum]